MHRRPDGARVWLRVDCIHCPNPRRPDGHERYVRGEYAATSDDGLAKVLVQAFEMPRVPPSHLADAGIKVGVRADLPHHGTARRVGFRRLE